MTMTEAGGRSAAAVAARLETHEEVCALRYAGINARLKRLEWILIVSSGGIITFLAGLVVTVLTLRGN